MYKGFILFILLGLALPFISSREIIGKDFVKETSARKGKARKNGEGSNLIINNAEEIFDFWDFNPSSKDLPGKTASTIIRKNSFNKQKKALAPNKAIQGPKVFGTKSEQNKIKEIDRLLKEVDSLVIKLEKLSPQARNLETIPNILLLINEGEEPGVVPEEEDSGSIPEEEETGQPPEEEEEPGTIPEEEEEPGTIPEEEETGQPPEEEEEEPGTIPEEEETGQPPEEEEEPGTIPEEEETGQPPEEEEEPGTIPGEEEPGTIPEEEETGQPPEEDEEPETVPEEEEETPETPVPTIGPKLTGSIRYNMTLGNFEAQNGRKKFIKDTSRILGIIERMIRVLGVREGSVIVDFEIAVEEGNGVTTEQAAKQIQDISDKLDKAVKNGDMNIYGVPVLDYESKVIEETNPPTSSSGGSGAGVAIGIVLGIIAVVIIVIVYTVYKRRTHAKVSREKSYKASVVINQMRDDFENQSEINETSRHRDEDSFSMYKIK